MSLTELLLATQNPASRADAEAQIKLAEQNNAEQYFIALATELAAADKPVIARQLAGLLLKNALYAKDAQRSGELKARWARMAEATRSNVKQLTAAALVTPEVDVGKAAAQVLAKIGAIEIPAKQWDGLVPHLLTLVTGQEVRSKNIALICLGYLCEELVALQPEETGQEVSEEISNNILTAVVEGMRSADLATKLEATRAFYHAVVLAQKNFRNQTERDFIIQVLHECCRTQGAEMVQIAAFECLVQVATEYYDYLMSSSTPYISILGPLTWETIKGANEKIAIPAMEFWSTICDEEVWIADLQANGQLGERRSLNLIQQSLPHLVPLLTETLTRQQHEEEEDSWNLRMAASTCLSLVAQVVADQCVDLVLAFVEQHFANPDWKYREAAILAFGSIMEGPSSQKMGPLVQNCYQHLVNALNDQSVAVRDTIAWTLGRIVQFHPTIVPIQSLTPVLGQKLQDLPRVAANVCFVIQCLSEAQQAPNLLPGQYPATTPLSEFFTSLAQALVHVTARQDASEKNLRMNAYHALSALIDWTGNDCLVHMDKLVPEMLNHLTAMHAQGQTLDRECELRGHVCGVLTALVNRLKEGISAHADRIMEQALNVITAYQQVKNEPCLQEEALILVDALAIFLKGGFQKYMQVFAPHLKTGLQNSSDVKVCIVSLGMVGDLARGLEAQVVAICDDVFNIAFAHLQNQAVDRKIKVAIMQTFGDVALAITGNFEKYLTPVVGVLSEACKTKLTDCPPTEDWIEYLGNLREAVLEAYTGIIHGLKDGGKLELFKLHANTVLHFISTITDEPPNETVWRAAIAVIGDLTQVFQQEMVGHLKGAPMMLKIGQFAQASSDPKVQGTGHRLQQLLVKFGGGIN
jgi:importin subunit beta-1